MKIFNPSLFFSSRRAYTIFLVLLSLIALMCMALEAQLLLHLASIAPRREMPFLLWTLAGFGIVVFASIPIICLIGLVSVCRTPHIPRKIKLLGLILTVTILPIIKHDIIAFLYLLSFHHLLFHKFLSNPNNISKRQFVQRIVLAIASWLIIAYTVLGSAGILATLI